MVQLLRIEHGFVDHAPVDRGDHLQARRDVDVHAVDADDVDLLRLGLMHRAQLGEAVRLLVLHRDAGLLGEGVAEGAHDRLLPGAAVAEIGDRPFGGRRGAGRQRDQRREQRGAGGGRGERPQEVATSETARLQQESAQARTGLVHIFTCIAADRAWLSSAAILVDLAYLSAFFCPPLGGARPHGLGLERPVAHVEIGLEAALALGLEQLLAVLVVRGVRERTERAFEQEPGIEARRPGCPAW